MKRAPKRNDTISKMTKYMWGQGIKQLLDTINMAIKKRKLRKLGNRKRE